MLGVHVHVREFDPARALLGGTIKCAGGSDLPREIEYYVYPELRRGFKALNPPGVTGDLCEEKQQLPQIIDQTVKTKMNQARMQC